MSSIPSDPFLLPPLDKYNIIGTWMETLLYGINVILFSLCAYVLLRKKSKAPGQWPLLATSCILFILASIHVAAALRQLLECFVYAARTGIPGSGILYWLNFFSTTQEIKGYCYVFIDTMQDLVLIWRLYVVWGNRWEISLLPLMLEIAHFVIAIYETVISQKENGIPFSSNLSLVAYILVIIVNIGTTAGIAARLWYMGRRHQDNFVTSWSSVSYSSNRYLAPIFTIIESGAIFTVSSVVLLALFVRNDPQLAAGVDVGTQLACTTPLLIIVRVGFGITHSIGRKKRGPGASLPTIPVNTISRFRANKSDVSQTPTGSVAESGVYDLEEMRQKTARSLTDYNV